MKRMKRMKRISQREASRWRKRALAAEALLADKRAIVDQVIERHHIATWAAPEYFRTVDIAERMGFRVEVTKTYPSEHLNVYAVRRRQP